MSERIEVGDLVMVVAGPRCCGSTASIGQVFKVMMLGPFSDVGYCRSCNLEFPSEDAAFDSRDLSWVQLYRLKKLPPLTEPERAAEREGVKA